MLNERGGFPIVNVDGDFGPSTDQSVKHYQQNENLTVDGIVGKQTWTSLLCCSRHQVEWVKAKKQLLAKSQADGVASAGRRLTH